MTNLPYDNLLTKVYNYIYTGAIALVTILLCMLVSCQRDERQHVLSTADNTKRLNTLRQLDDSIAKLAPSAEKTALDGMAKAADSLTHYEYKLRLAKYYWLSERPERSDTIVSNILRYTQNASAKYNDEQSTQRINSLIAGAYNCRAAFYHNFHRNTSETIRLYSNAYHLLSMSDQKFYMPKICANLADAYIQTNDMPRAAQWYRRALFLVDSLKLPEKENVTLYMGLAQIYLSLHDFDTALYYYNATEKYFKLMSPSMQAYYLNNFGNYHYFHKDYKVALSTFLRMKRNIEHNGMEKNFDMFLCKLNLADVYLNLDSISQASKYLNEVEPYFVERHDPIAQYYCHTIRIGIATHTGNTSTVRRILNSEDKTQQIPYTMVNLRNQYMQSFYEQTGDYKSAFYNMKANINYNDSLEHNRSNMRSADIMARFTSDTLKLHHDLAIEHKNADLQRANRNTTLAIAAAAVLLLALTLWLMYTKKKQFEARMNIMDLKLDIVRNRISPHFVFNVLNNKIINSDQHEASELLELTKLIRTNLDMSRAAAVTLASEVAFVEQYIRVERYLLGDDFHFSVHIGNNIDTEKVKVPSMFLQILTENAIIHGLKGRDGHKELSISISRQHTTTTITVADNGPGFNASNGTLRKRTGLGAIAQTVAVTNEYNKNKMRFEIRNRTDNNGNITGCTATLRVPDGVRFK